MLNKRLAEIDSPKMEDIYREIQKFEKTGALEDGVLRKIFDEEDVSNVHVATFVVYQELSKRWYDEREMRKALENRVDELQFIIENENIDMRGYRV